MKWWLFGILVVLSPEMHADEPRAFFNPGIKLGHTFGAGFTFGIELSYTYLTDQYGVGMLVDYDISREMSKFHVGIEGMRAGAGLSFGPAWVTGYDRTKPGFTITGFLGLLLYPYYSYTFGPDLPGFHEAGSYVKMSIQTRGRKFSLGG